MPQHDAIAEVEPYIALLRVADSVRDRLEDSLGGIGLSWARYEVVRMLAERGTMTISDLGNSLLRHRTSIGVTLAGLEKSGLVERRSNPRKRQQYLVSVTTRGRAVLAKADRVLSRGLQQPRLDHAALSAALDALRLGTEWRLRSL